MSAPPVFPQEGETYVLARYRGRLAQLRAETWGNRPQDWQRRWAPSSVEAILDRHAQGQLGELELLARHLPRDRAVLEAGCGLGQLVLALHARGFRVEGVDYDPETLERVRAVAPQLDLRHGDVYDLDVPDGHYGGYVSIGVFEHDAEGPRRGLEETFRVLAPGGVALISVPYLNRQRRRLLGRLGESTGDAPGFTFYQYYYSRREFADHLRSAGLELVDTLGYGVYAGLTRDFRLGRHLHSRGFYAYPLQRGVSRWSVRAPGWARRRWGHMMMYVCRRPDRPSVAVPR